jgi:hypothetical protein
LMSSCSFWYFFICTTCSMESTAGKMVGKCEPVNITATCCQYYGCCRACAD